MISWLLIKNDSTPLLPLFLKRDTCHTIFYSSVLVKTELLEGRREMILGIPRDENKLDSH